MVVGVVFSAGAQAAPGDLDLTFSGDGKQRTDFGFGASGAAATVRQPDGKIVAVGQATNIKPGFATPGDFALARYNADGTLDTSFSGDGKQRTDFGGNPDGATGVVLQADGKIVVVGSSIHDDGGGYFALARYNPDGSLDASFSGDGKQTTNFGSSGVGGATGVALQGDGKIVVVGSSNFGGSHTSDFALARYNPNGSLDTSFSGDGRQTTTSGRSPRRTEWRYKRTARSSRSAPTGTAATSRSPVTTSTARSTRASPATASRRPTSGASTKRPAWRSKATARSSRSAPVATATSRSPATTRTARSTRASPATASRRPTSGARTGRAGWRSRATARSSRSAAAGGDFALARYNSDGTLDPSFSGDGKQTTDFGSSDGASGVAVQGDGKIVAVGGTEATAGRNFALARYNSDGSLDTSFSGDGKQTTGGFAGFDSAGGVAVQGDGKIVVVGRRRRPGLRARPLQPERVARHELLRRRQADDRLRLQ